MFPCLGSFKDTGWFSACVQHQLSYSEHTHWYAFTTDKNLRKKQLKHVPAEITMCCNTTTKLTWIKAWVEIHNTKNKNTISIVLSDAAYGHGRLAYTCLYIYTTFVWCVFDFMYKSYAEMCSQVKCSLSVSVHILSELNITCSHCSSVLYAQAQHTHTVQMLSFHVLWFFYFYTPSSPLNLIKKNFYISTNKIRICNLVCWIYRQNLYG